MLDFRKTLSYTSPYTAKILMRYQRKTPKIRKPHPVVIGVRVNADMNERLTRLSRKHHRSKRSTVELFVMNGLRVAEKDPQHGDYLLGRNVTDVLENSPH